MFQAMVPSHTHRTTPTVSLGMPISKLQTSRSTAYPIIAAVRAPGRVSGAALCVSTAAVMARRFGGRW
jgi:hypothetical protein